MIEDTPSIKDRNILLTEDEKKLLASAINRFGDDQHPFADEYNIEYFTTPYVRKCLKRAKKGLKEEYKHEADALLEKLTK